MHTWALVACLLAIGATAWYFLQEPSADVLYAKITARAADGRIESLRDVEDEVHRFLARFPDDPRREELEQIANEITWDRLDRKFELIARGLGSAEGLLPIEQAYVEAIGYARFDSERGAAKLRATIDLFDDSGAPASRPSDRAKECLRLAERRLATLEETLSPSEPSHLGELRKQLDRADGLRQAEPERATAMYRAIIELYGNKPWASDLVDRARAALEQ